MRVQRAGVAWASAELGELLAQLTAQQAAGVVRIVQAELAGKPLSSLLDCPGQICTSTTYYGSGRRTGWQDRPTFRKALATARRDYRAWWLEHGTSEALHVLASATPSAARALKQQIEGDPDAIAVLVAMLEAEDQAERLKAIKGLAATGLPSVVPYLAQALANEKNPSLRLTIIVGLAEIAGLRDGERRLSAAAVLDRADVKTALKQSQEIDEDALDAEIERRLAELAAGGQAADVASFEDDAEDG